MILQRLLGFEWGRVDRGMYWWDPFDEKWRVALLGWKGGLVCCRLSNDFIVRAENQVDKFLADGQGQ